MGPRSRERGNWFKPHRRIPLLLLLQWGRAHVSAETISNSALAAATVLASMGPRSRERGNTYRY